VLVLHDLLDMHGADTFQPKFVKRFAHIGEAMRAGVTAYADEVRGRTFPAPEHAFAITPEELSAFTTAVQAGSSEDNILADW
jgi:3-methyl-2-oxobutanoate hydroxymethyltransferase